MSEELFIKGMRYIDGEWIFFGDMTGDDEKLRERIPNYDGDYKEAMLAYAAARILGKEHVIPDVSILEDKDVPEGCDLPESLREIQRYGMVGFHFTHELQHIAMRAGIDVNLGVRVFHEVAEKLLPIVEALREYVEWLEENPRRFISP
ncbi:MAG TPA: hypothetical protein EYP10_01620 [Armatimonadetes bacterium]|nr:hypothetical protein [Armatimonadota bacterium]